MPIQSNQFFKSLLIQSFFTFLIFLYFVVVVIVATSQYFVSDTFTPHTNQCSNVLGTQDLQFNCGLSLDAVI